MAEDDDKVTFEKAPKRDVERERARKEIAEGEGSKAQKEMAVKATKEATDRLLNEKWRWRLAFGLAIINDIADPIEVATSIFTAGLGEAVGYALDALTSAVLWPIIGPRKSKKALLDLVPGLDILPFYTWQTYKAYQERNLPESEKGGDVRSEGGGAGRRAAPARRPYNWSRMLGIALLILLAMGIGSWAFGAFGSEIARTGPGRALGDFAEAPQETFVRGVNSTVNAIDLALLEVWVGLRTRPKCQRRSIDQSIRSDKKDAFMEYCTCNNLGLDNWKTLNRGRDIEACSELRAEDEEERVQELRVNAENYLDLKVRTRVEDGSDELRDVCGSRCGVVRATFINKGEFGGAGKDITVNGFYLEIRGGVEGGKLPMIIASDKITEAGGEKGKKYKLDYFINGRDTQGEWQSSRDVGIEIAPGQEKTVTFLANITPYHTYTRKCVNSEMKSQRDTVKSELEEDKTLTVEDYCSERGGIYQGEELKASEKSSQKYNAEKFNEYSGQICNEQAKDAVEGCVDEDKIFTEYRSEFKPAVVVNYTSTTSNKLDAIALNSQKWNEMTLEKRKDFEEDNCIGREGQILRQSPDNSQLIDAVSLIIQSDCTGLRYDPEEPSESEGSVHVSAKGDSEEITAFKVNSITRPEGTEEICTEETKYKDLGSEGWFKCDSEDCKTKEMSCKKRVPPIPDGETTTLNFGLEAEYTARTVEEGRFILSGIS